MMPASVVISRKLLCAFSDPYDHASSGVRKFGESRKYRPGPMPRYGCVPITRRLDITNCCLKPDPLYVGSRSICQPRTSPNTIRTATTPEMIDIRLAFAHP